MRNVLITGGFDHIDSEKIRFFQEVSKSGLLHVAVLDDVLLKKVAGKSPEFPLAERLYFVENIRYVYKAVTVSSLELLDDVTALTNSTIDRWCFLPCEPIIAFQEIAHKQDIPYRVMPDDMLKGFPDHDYSGPPESGKKVIVSGCFDWFHTGHIRFFEEAVEYGDLYVVVGHDKNIRKLKGAGHPKFSENERKYLAGSIRFVKQALISSGGGWLDAEPEIERIKPDYYVVNEDGHKEIKRQYCEMHGIEYIVLKRNPRPGLKRRTSTALRGF